MSNWIPEQLESLANMQLNDIAEGLVDKLNLEQHPIVQLECSLENGVQTVKYEFRGIPKDTTHYSGYNHPVNLKFRFEDGDLKYGYANLHTSAANVQDGADVDYTLTARGGKLDGEPTTVAEIMDRFKEEVNHYMEHGNDMVNMLTDLRSEVHADMKQRFPKRVSRLKRTFDHENTVIVEFNIDNVVHEIETTFNMADRTVKVGSNNIDDRIAKVRSTDIQVDPTWNRAEVAERLKETIREATTAQILPSHDVQSMGYDDTEVGRKFAQVHQAAIDALTESKVDTKRKWNPLRVETDGSQLVVRGRDHHPHTSGPKDREFNITFDAETDDVTITVQDGWGLGSKPEPRTNRVKFTTTQELTNDVFDALDLGIARADNLLDDLGQNELQQ